MCLDCLCLIKKRQVRGEIQIGMVLLPSLGEATKVPLEAPLRIWGRIKGKGLLSLAPVLAHLLQLGRTKAKSLFYAPILILSLYWVQQVLEAFLTHPA